MTIQTPIPTAEEIVGTAWDRTIGELVKATGVLLAECTDAQRELFGRLYPGKPPTVEVASAAYDTVRRTVLKNRAGRAPAAGGAR